MRRTVALVICAAVLLSPACGMAAPKQGGELSLKLRNSWWASLAEWAAFLFIGEAVTPSGEEPVSAGGGEGEDPVAHTGTTWDANG